MKSVLISIQPKWCELIAIGKKTIEVRKTAPKLQTPFKCYIYCTNEKHKGEVLLIGNDGKQVAFGDYRNAFHWKNIGNGKVVGEFVCDRIDKIKPLYEFYREIGYDLNDDQQAETCLTRDELKSYGKGNPLYGLHISDLKIYDTPKELREFWRPCPNKSTEKILDCAAGIKSCKYKTEELPFQCTAHLTRPPQSWCYVD